MATQAFEVPARPGQPEVISISLGGVTYTLRLTWNEPAGLWILDIADVNGVPILNGVPLVTGANMIDQQGTLIPDAAFIAQSDQDYRLPPTFENLGGTGHLYYVPLTPAPAPVTRYPLAPQPVSTSSIPNVPEWNPPQSTPPYCIPAVTFEPGQSLGSETFDPDLIGSNVPDYLIFSNDNLTVTGGAYQGQTPIDTSYYGTGIALSQKTSGNYYWEMHIDLCTSEFTSVGTSSFADQTEPQTGAYLLGGDSFVTDFGFAYRSDGTVRFAPSLSFPTFTTGDVIGFAMSINPSFTGYDGRSAALWISKNGVWLNGNPGDPTNAFMLISPSNNIPTRSMQVPAAQPGVPGDQITVNFGATPYAYERPAGYGDWIRTAKRIGSLDVAPATVISYNNDDPNNPFNASMGIPYVDLPANGFDDPPGSPTYAQKCVSKFTATETMQVFSVSAPLQQYGATVTRVFSHLTAIIYSDDSGDPGEFIAKSASIEVGQDTGFSFNPFNFDWNIYEFPISVTLPPGDYWIGFLGDDFYEEGTSDPPDGPHDWQPWQQVSYLPNGTAYSQNAGGLVPDESFGTPSYVDHRLTLQVNYNPV